MSMIRLIDVAEVIRSKNSGPFELTFDILFKDWTMFETFCHRNLITKELIANLYQIPVSKVINVVHFKPAKALKFTIVRPLPSGAMGDTDIYGAQQHAPLLGLEFDV
jgi:hypothetical protein